MPHFDVRPLTEQDLPAAWELGRLAFGNQRQPPAGWTAEWRREQGWGVFDGSGRLVAQALDREQGHWFGGRLVPASGVAGVVVAPELRGTGLARKVLTCLLASARERGAAVSTLFPTTPLPYRRLGWEEIGALTCTALPTHALAGIRRPAQMTLRAATVEDVPDVLAAYQAVARAGTGLLDRSARPFDPSPHAVLTEHDGVTVTRGPDGRMEGYASWDRVPERAGVPGALSVPDLVGLTDRATASLLAMLATWASVAPTLLFRLPDPDPASLIASFAGARVESRRLWMLRIVDASAAVAARGWPRHLSGSVDLSVDDDVCPWNSGAYRLVLADGTGRLEHGGRAEVRLAVRGLALLYAGAGGSALLRRAGLLQGGDADTDAFLDAAAAGPRPALLDPF